MEGHPLLVRQPLQVLFSVDHLVVLLLVMLLEIEVAIEVVAPRNFTLKGAVTGRE